MASTDDNDLTLDGPQHRATARALGSVPATERRRLFAVTAFRSLVFAAAIFVAYSIITFRGEFAGESAVRALLAAAVFIAVLVLEFRSITTARYPQLKAVEAFAVAIPMTLVVFASIYIMMAESDPAAFNEPLNHISSMYFTMTGMTTIGFGDVNPVSDVARVAVMVQMVVNLAVIAIGTRVVLRLVQKTIEESDDN